MMASGREEALLGPVGAGSVPGRRGVWSVVSHDPSRPLTRSDPQEAHWGRYPSRFLRRGLSVGFGMPPSGCGWVPLAHCHSQRLPQRDTEPRAVGALSLSGFTELDPYPKHLLAACGLVTALPPW